MNKFTELLFKLHVSVKYMGGNPKEEIFFPSMFLSAWINMIVQFIGWLIYFRLSYEVKIFIYISEPILKIILLSIAALTAYTLFQKVKHDKRYLKAEEWYEAKTKWQKRKTLILTGFIIFPIFFTLLIWAVWES